MAERDEQEISVDNSAPGWSPSDHRTGSQEHQSTHTDSRGTEETGTQSPRRQNQGPRRATLTVWAEGTGTEGDEGCTKAKATRSELSHQIMEDASTAKLAWTQYIQAAGATAGTDQGQEQDVRQIRDKDQVQTLLSLLTRIGGGRDPTWEEVEGLLREGSDWIQNVVQPYLQEVRSWGGMSS